MFRISGIKKDGLIVGMSVAAVNRFRGWADGGFDFLGWVNVDLDFWRWAKGNVLDW